MKDNNIQQQDIHRALSMPVPMPSGLRPGIALQVCSLRLYPDLFIVAGVAQLPEGQDAVLYVLIDPVGETCVSQTLRDLLTDGPWQEAVQKHFNTGFVWRFEPFRLKRAAHPEAADADDMDHERPDLNRYTCTTRDSDALTELQWLMAAKRRQSR